jgi:hypothetical protein
MSREADIEHLDRLQRTGDWLKTGVGGEDLDLGKLGGPELVKLYGLGNLRSIYL